MKNLIECKYCSQECFHRSKYPTIPEQLVKNRLRKEKVWFRFQKSISDWTVDFLLSGKIIFEADGDYWHGKKDQKIKDAIRDKSFKKLGYQVYRFPEKNLVKTQGNCINSRLRKLSLL